jgi:UDP-N-acetylglucosamine transferase subunit ALG13
LAFLQQEFPNLKTIVIPGYEVTYGDKGSVIKLFYESVKFFNFIKEEHQNIDKIVEEHNIDMIVSDNRYGLYSEKAESIIVTHQLYPKAPIGESIVHDKIAKLLSNFNKVWIPDYEGENNLSGDLSHLKPFNQNHKFLGPLSRFSTFGSAQGENLEFDVCAMLSGPEPQRTIFEKLIFKQIEKHKLKAVVVRGLPNETLENDKMVFNHLPTKQLQEFILKSKVVVCRTGYSSIMDLATLGKKAILVPTPGQTEQEYLADYHKNNLQFLVQQQKELNLKI